MGCAIAGLPVLARAQLTDQLRQVCSDRLMKNIDVDMAVIMGEPVAHARDGVPRYGWHCRSGLRRNSSCRLSNNLDEVSKGELHDSVLSQLVAGTSGQQFDRFQRGSKHVGDPVFVVRPPQSRPPRTR